MANDKVDKTGRDRIAKNLAARWLGQVVVIVSGFVVPRMIDTRLGASSLGVWDFGWSTVAYFRFLGLGLAGGLNRYVALHTAEGDDARLQRAISSTVLLQVMVAVLSIGLSIALAFYAPVFFDELPVSEIRETRLLLLFFGATIAVRMLFWPARGILTGMHRTTITAAVTAAGDLMVLAALFSTLILGGGLSELGFAVLSVAVLTELVRAVFASRICHVPIFRWNCVDVPTIRKMFRFGIKNNITALPGVLVVQGTSILLAGAAGPATLAVFARPIALCTLVGRMIRQYSLLLTPIAGSMQGLKQHQEMRAFFVEAVMASFSLTFPALLLLGFYGDVVIRAWMGDDYVVTWLAPSLCAAFFLPTAHAGALRILAGLDAHGRVGVWSLVATAVVYLIVMSTVARSGLDLKSAAIAIGISLSAGPGFVIMIAACRRFSVTAKQYFGEIVWPPFMCNIPVLLFAAGSRFFVPDMSFSSAVLCGFIGMSVTMLCYWQFLLTPSLKRRITRRFAPGRRKRKG